KQSPATSNKIVMGPWYHGQWASRDGSRLGNVRFGRNTSFDYQNNIEIPFFNYYLKRKGDDPALPEATIFFTGENTWKQLPQWPPQNMTPTALYLQSGGNLSWNAGGTAYREYISDPAHPVPYTE